MTEPRSPLTAWLEDESSWTEMPGVTDLNVEVIDMTPPLLVSRELAEELGYTIAAGPRPPTPIEKALAILAPHLDSERLYQPAARDR